MPDELVQQLRLLDYKMGEMQKAIEAIRVYQVEHDREWIKLKAEHESCKLKHERESSWLGNRFGGLIDKLLPVLLALGMSYMISRGGR